MDDSGWAAEHRDVIAVESAYDRAWCERDLDALLECLTTDAVLVNPLGETAVGRDEIRSALGRFFDRGEPTVHQTSVERVSFVTDRVAVVDGRAVVRRDRQATGGHEVVEHLFTDILVRDDAGAWRIAHIRAHGLRRRGA